MLGDDSGDTVTVGSDQPAGRQAKAVGHDPVDPRGLILLLVDT